MQNINKNNSKKNNNNRRGDIFLTLVTEEKICVKSFVCLIFFSWSLCLKFRRKANKYMPLIYCLVFVDVKKAACSTLMQTCLLHLNSNTSVFHIKQRRASSIYTACSRNLAVSAKFLGLISVVYKEVRAFIQVQPHQKDISHC
jgi:hypothetical protein